MAAASSTVTLRAVARAGVSPGDTILAAAAGALPLGEEGEGAPPSAPDAVVLTHHPKGWLSRALTGSVAAAVLARGACGVPVVVLHAPRKGEVK